MRDDDDQRLGYGDQVGLALMMIVSGCVATLVLAATVAAVRWIL